MACKTLGAVQETPDKPIATYISTFRPMTVRVMGGTRRRIVHVDTLRGFEVPGMFVVFVCILAFRQSAHSVAVCEPIENPLNDLPQLGQVGTFKNPLDA
jgi:hypothetical protein